MERENSGDPLFEYPEEGERLVVNSIVVPADEQIPLLQTEVAAAVLDDCQRIVGGDVQPIRLERPAAHMYIQEEGKLQGLQSNARATLLLWMHRPEFRYADYIVGDVCLVGPLDGSGNCTNAPDELLQTLFQAKRFRPEVQVYGELGWHGNQRRFNNWVDAYSYVLDLGRRWTNVQDVRVVPEA